MKWAFRRFYHSIYFIRKVHEGYMEHVYIKKLKKDQRKFRNYILPISILFIFILAFAFIYSPNDNFWDSLFILSIADTFLFLSIHYFIAPKLHYIPVRQAILLTSIYLAATMAMHFFLFEYQILEYPYFLKIKDIPLVFKLSLFFLLSTFLYFAAWIIFLIVNTYQISIESYNKTLNAYHTEINLLRQQMNPHFLFNALNNINSLLRQNQINTAIEYNSDIAELLNNHLLHVDASYISMEEEISWLENYIQTEQKRTPGKFDYRITIENPDIMLCHIPPMLLQPLVENSIIHGFSLPAPVNKKYLSSIEIRELDEKTIYIRIEDNGAGSNAPFYSIRKRKSISLTNIEKRIQLINEIGNFEIYIHRDINEHGAINELTIRDMK